ncbi:MAG TPA: PDZ domain-containing protein [Tenuifilum sp.]|uniref:S41 family peptidase n=1 Tax=Tenuifilum sp. TaxID=2760880 RepID=UPI002BD8DEA3|nr:PDZ domain-containing protein [Tenuifilum sp.]HRR11463.1 PDZ domain-containing protein [Tenuifilum sp.]
MKKLLLWVLAIAFTITAVQGQEARLMRFPAVHNNQVVFTYAGDLYTVDISGGVARKLTTHVGYEMFPHFSPDGRTIAFTGQYDGNTEVFSIPAEGGTPMRLTHTATLNRDDISDRMGPNNIVMAWTPDGEKIVYRSRKQSFNDFKGQLFMVPVNGGMSEELPLSTGGFCSFSPDGKKLAFNRVFREFRTWKYYKGGMADDIWIFDFNTKEVTNITSNPAQDIFPMWIGDEIFFLSDRDRTMNLFVYNTKTKNIEKVTNYNDYDIKFPSFDHNSIVFEKGGFLFAFDVKTRTTRKINITITDDQNYSRPSLVDASKRITNADLSPNGERVVFSARGDVYTLPSEKGITYNLTASSDVHEREATWSPDGKWIAYLSDKTGEYEVYIQPQDGSMPATQVTSGINNYIFGIEWSPDSKKILFSDRLGRLQYVDIETKAVTLVTKGKYGLVNSYSWSPDSKWIAYSTSDANRFSVVYIYGIDSKTTNSVTNGWFSSYGPVFSNDGKYLLYVSDREFNPIYSNTEWNHAYVDMSNIYIVMLSKDTPSPFALENNEVKPETKTEQPKDKDSAKKPAKTEEKPKPEVQPVKIDFDGIENRTVELPGKAGRYYNIYCIDGKVYYNYSSSKDRQPVAMMYDLKKQKETELGESIRFTISSNGKKMLVSKNRTYAVIDLPTGKINMEKTIDLSDMKVWVDYHKEWKQIFDESWRQMRDFFYVENMHGVDWKAIHDKYAVLVPYVNHRNDLTYIIGEMIGELNVGHAYVNSGDKPEPERIKTGLLGAKLSKHSSGYFRVDKILEGANWSDALRSPLAEIGVNVKEGDYIISVDGVDLKNIPDIYSTLINKADKTVALVVNSSPQANGGRKVLVKPIADESELYYYTWVQNNIRKVNEATNGEVGYIHIPDMGVAGLNEFVKYFYPQLTKKALIIDDRGNGGGNVSPMILERLSRVVYRMTMRRGFDQPSTIPSETHYGPKVVLIDRYSASDGDLFPYGFKKLGLGPLIGVRSWGGVVGISGSLPFVDGGDLRKPEFTSFSSDTGEWIIEGHGVDPDIEIDNDPYREYMGQDDQLNKAIEQIKVMLKDYKPLPQIPQAPDRSK